MAAFGQKLGGTEVCTSNIGAALEKVYDLRRSRNSSSKLTLV